MFSVLILNDLWCHRQKLIAEFYVMPKENRLLNFLFRFFWQNSYQFSGSSSIALLILWCSGLFLFLRFGRRVLGGKFGYLLRLMFVWFYLIGIVTSSGILMRFTVISSILLFLLFFDFGSNLSRCLGIKSWDSVWRLPAANFLAHISILVFSRKNYYKSAKLNQIAWN